ncbi:hypothetical protein [Crocosphaera sp.]|uniref:hypothetical protein n=1 Tax=Crocosphaera sp. TaxID=2729996 RepID=UPI003F26E680|nr:hypothetical protein [Crocosphaera sp.]
MSNPSPEYQSLGPLSVGNVISAAARIYRDRFPVYYKLALISYFWLLVPIYGWAKFMAISGLLSRLAYGEVSGKPESVREARRYINPRLWTFFLTALLVGLIFFAWYIFFGIILVIFIFVLGSLGSSNSSVLLGLIFGLLFFIGLIMFIVSLIWLNSRLYLADLAIAIENQSSPSTAINRSWQLTKEFIWRIMLISFVAFLIAIPASLLVQLIDSLVRWALLVIFPEGSFVAGVIYFLLYLATSFPISALLVPFWQSIKAVVYYDLRTRREGIDIQLRDSI